MKAIRGLCCLAVPVLAADPSAASAPRVGVIVRDFDATLAMLKERNVEIAFGPYPARENQRANVIIRDNAGSLIQFLAR